MNDTDDMESHLLRLPSELRNRIYEYYLTNYHKGVCYHDNKNGVSWLCLHSHPASALEKETVAPDTEAEGPNRTRHKVIKRSVDQPEKAGTAMVRVNKHIIANQLQFVNRQLRDETKGLATRYNDISTFDSFIHIQKLLGELNLHQKARLLMIIFKTETEWDERWMWYTYPQQPLNGRIPQLRHPYLLSISSHGPDVFS